MSHFDYYSFTVHEEYAPKNAPISIILGSQPRYLTPRQFGTFINAIIEADRRIPRFLNKIEVDERVRLVDRKLVHIGLYYDIFVEGCLGSYLQKYVDICFDYEWEEESPTIERDFSIGLPIDKWDGFVKDLLLFERELRKKEVIE